MGAILQDLPHFWWISMSWDVQDVPEESASTNLLLTFSIHLTVVDHFSKTVHFIPLTNTPFHSNDKIIAYPDKIQDVNENMYARSLFLFSFIWFSVSPSMEIFLISSFSCLILLKLIYADPLNPPFSYIVGDVCISHPAFWPEYRHNGSAWC